MKDLFGASLSSLQAPVLMFFLCQLCVCITWILVYLFPTIPALCQTLSGPDAVKQCLHSCTHDNHGLRYWCFEYLHKYYKKSCDLICSRLFSMSVYGWAEGSGGKYLSIVCQVLYLGTMLRYFSIFISCYLILLLQYSFYGCVVSSTIYIKTAVIKVTFHNKIQIKLVVFNPFIFWPFIVSFICCIFMFQLEKQISL